MNRRPGSHTTSFIQFPAEREFSSGVNPYRGLHAEYEGVIPAIEGPGYKGRWHEAFGRTAPLQLELGAGSGEHLVGMAELYPDQNWLGLEVRFKRVVLVARKLEELKNVRILRYSWFFLHELFDEGSIAGLHMHHPDPWPKRDQAHNRVIDPEFVGLMGRLMAPGAEWRMKTDFEPHIEALRASIPGHPFELLDVRRDIKKQGTPWEKDVMSAYQRKSFDRDQPVHAIWLRRA